MEELELKVPTPGGQLLDFCLKTIREQQQLDANTMLALLSLVNLTNILELIGQGQKETAQVPKLPKEDALPSALAEVIPPGSDKMAMVNNLMGMLGGGEISKLMPLITMLGSALKNNPQPQEEQPPPQPEEEPKEEPTASERQVPDSRPSGWARVGR